MSNPLGGASLASPLGVTQGAAAVPHWSTLGSTIDPSHIAAWTPKGAASLAASYTQYGTLPSSFAVGIAPTLSAGGWAFNGSSQYLKTGIIPTDITWSVFAQYTGLVASEFVTIVGAQESASKGLLLQVSGGALGMAVQNGNIVNNTPNFLNGNFGIAGLTPYRDGVADSNTVSAGGTPSTIELYIGAANVSGSPVVHSDLTISAIAIYNNTLTAPQVLALATAMAAL